MNHHVTLETSQRLKAAGFPQDTLFLWYRPTAFIVRSEWNIKAQTKIGRMFDNKAVTNDHCAAPILTEVMEKLPEDTNVRRLRRDYEVTANVEQYGFYHENNPAEAAALLWLKLGEDA